MKTQQPKIGYILIVLGLLCHNHIIKVKGTSYFTGSELCKVGKNYFVVCNLKMELSVVNYDRE